MCHFESPYFAPRETPVDESFTLQGPACHPAIRSAPDENFNNDIVMPLLSSWNLAAPASGRF
jgi:hypothetical protein